MSRESQRVEQWRKRNAGEVYLDTDAVLEDSLGGVDGDLVVGLVAVLEAEVIVLEVDVEERQDQVLLDLVPAARNGSQSGGGRGRRKKAEVASRVGRGWRGRCRRSARRPAVPASSRQDSDKSAHDTGHLVTVHLLERIAASAWRKMRNARWSSGRRGLTSTTGFWTLMRCSGLICMSIDFPYRLDGYSIRTAQRGGPRVG